MESIHGGILCLSFAFAMMVMVGISKYLKRFKFFNREKY